MVWVSCACSTCSSSVRACAHDGTDSHEDELQGQKRQQRLHGRDQMSLVCTLPMAWHHAVDDQLAGVGLSRRQQRAHQRDRGHADGAGRDAPARSGQRP